MTKFNFGFTKQEPLVNFAAVDGSGGTMEVPAGWEEEFRDTQTTSQNEDEFEKAKKEEFSSQGTVSDLEINVFDPEEEKQKLAALALAQNKTQPSGGVDSAQIAALLAQVQAQTSSGNESLAKVLKELGGQLSQNQQNQGAQAARPKSLDELIAENEEEVIRDPAKGIKKIFAGYEETNLKPAFQYLGSKIESLSTSLGKNLASATPEGKFAEKYPEEVMAFVKQNPGDPEAYVKACRQVAVTHFQDFVTFSAESTKPAETGQEPKKLQATTPPGNLVAKGTPGSLGSGTGQGGRTVNVPKAALEGLKQEALALGVDYKELAAMRYGEGL